MIRRFLTLAAVLIATQFSAQADAGDSIKSSVLESNVAYFLVGDMGKNLPEEIQSAENTLAVTNKIAGTILDLRFTGGNDLDSEKSAEDLLAQEKLPLAILVNDQTRGAAVKLAEDLREAKAGLIFGSSTELKPDIAVSVSAADEKKFLKNPWGTISTNETQSASATTNDFLPFIDHTTEADLVREKIKDGDEDVGPVPVLPGPSAKPPKPFIRDPVLARGVDFIEGLEALQLSKK